MKLVFAVVLFMIVGMNAYAQPELSVAEPWKDPEIGVLDSTVKPDSIPVPLESFGKHLVYPPIALRAGMEGDVATSALIDTNGVVLKVKLVKSPHLYFNQAAMDAVKKTRFRPAYHQGKPVKVWQEVPVRFRIN